MTLDDYSPALAEAIINLPKAVLLVDAKSRIQFVNFAAIELFGYERLEIEGLLLDVFLPEQLRGMHRLKVEQFVATGRSTGLNAGHAQFSWTKKDGSAFPAEVTLSRLVMPGAPAMAMVIVTNLARRVPDERFIGAEVQPPEMTMALNMIDDNVVVLDREWRFLFVNEAMLRLNELQRADILGKKFWEIYPQFIGTPIDEAVKRAFDPPQQRAEQELYDPRSGRTYQVEVIPSPSTLILHTRDITERKQTRALYQQLTHSLDSINDPIMMMDRQWQYTFVNLAGAEFINQPRDELLGKNIWVLSPWLRETPFGQACMRAMESSAPFTLEDHYEPRNRWLNVYFFPGADGFTVHISDITDLKENQQQIAKLLSEKASEAQMQAVFDLMSTPMLLLDTELRYTYANAAALRVNDRTPEQMIGVKMWDLDPDASGTALAERCREALETGERQKVDIQLQPSGRWLSAEAIPWGDRVILSAVDISMLKESEKSVEILTSTLDQAMDSGWNRPTAREPKGPPKS
jgi:PAS domain S-box-containing protein